MAFSIRALLSDGLFKFGNDSLLPDRDKVPQNASGQFRSSADNAMTSHDALFEGGSLSDPDAVTDQSIRRDLRRRRNRRTRLNRLTRLIRLLLRRGRRGRGRLNSRSRSRSRLSVFRRWHCPQEPTIELPVAGKRVGSDEIGRFSGTGLRLVFTLACRRGRCLFRFWRDDDCLALPIGFRPG